MKYKHDVMSVLSIPRSAKGRSVRFDGDNFYSYNMKIARFYGEQKMILVAANTPSVTTHTHVTKLGYVIRGLEAEMPGFVGARVADVDSPTAKENLDHMVEYAKYRLKKAAYGRDNAPMHMEQYEKAVKFIEHYTETFGVDYNIDQIAPEGVLTPKRVASLIANKIEGKLNVDNRYWYWGNASLAFAEIR
jgi:hypothetical protein